MTKQPPVSTAFGLQVSIARRELILGGQRSGKSRRAEMLAEAWLGLPASGTAAENPRSGSSPESRTGPAVHVEPSDKAARHADTASHPAPAVQAPGVIGTPPGNSPVPAPSGKPPRRAIFVATATAGDDDMRARIRQHQADRAARLPGMQTLEEPMALAAIIRQHSRPDCLLLIDCLTLWLANHYPLDAGFTRSSAATDLLHAIETAEGPLVFVSNEIGLGVVPLGREVRAYVDALGWLNQQVAARCERVCLMAAGLPLMLKDEVANHAAPVQPPRLDIATPGAEPEQPKGRSPTIPTRTTPQSPAAHSTPDAHGRTYFRNSRMSNTLHAATPDSTGTVWFVGAGPGDPDLITVKGRDLIARAGAILFAGSLVSEAATRWAPADCEIADSKGMTLEEICAWLIERARRHEVVIRLQTGDPSLYGALIEMVQPLDEAGIPVSVVPGVSSAFAAAAASVESLTLPEVSQTVILTRIAGRTPMPEGEDLVSLARHRCTLCIFLSITLLGQLQRDLREAGWADDSPIVVVHKASWPGEERIIRSTLADVKEDCRKAKVVTQSMIIASPTLGARGWEDLVRSKLYDASFTHRFRRASAPEGAKEKDASGGEDA